MTHPGQPLLQLAAIRGRGHLGQDAAIRGSAWLGSGLRAVHAQVPGIVDMAQAPARSETRSGSERN